MPLASLYVSDKVAAQMLGHTIDWLRANREMLERQFGFPKVDPAVGKTHREAIEEWARQRNVEPLHKAQERLTETNRENFSAL